MNITAKILQRGSLVQTLASSVVLTNAQAWVATLFLSVLFSALSVIYVSHSSRTLTAGIQQMLAEQNRLHIQWGQLLLQKSTWTMQSQVQHTAEGKLNMIMPDHKSVVIVSQ
ncbi:hypothetical protein AYO45_02795 [Gammaproteobacteria bacterium SCGC AG-212-F23]|nr:hypothetical protein AYO45_02795 [Gammaproteobacteria bacterium SCGC AG-212-F23]